MCKYKLVSVCTGQDTPHYFLDSVFLEYTRLIPDGRTNEKYLLSLVRPLSYLADSFLCMYVCIPVKYILHSFHFIPSLYCLGTRTTYTPPKESKSHIYVYTLTSPLFASLLATCYGTLHASLLAMYV